MAEAQPKKKRVLRKVETVREKSTKPVKEVKVRRLHTARKHAARPFKTAARVGRKEYYLPMPKNKVGNFLNKRRRLTPRFLIDSFKELRLVSWPNRRNTLNLTLAVFLFAFFFGLLIAVTDYGLDKLFKHLIIK